MPRGVRTARLVKRAQERELLPKDDDGTQCYGTVIKAYGNGRFQVGCDDGVERMCTVRGRMRRREWVGVHDIVLVALREYGDANADIITRYTPEETAVLRQFGGLQLEPQNLDEDLGNDVDIVFEDV